MFEFVVPYVLCKVFFDRNNSLEQFLHENYSLQDDQISKIISEINKRFLHFNQRFKSVYRIKTKFLEKCSHWMESVFVVNLCNDVESPSSNNNGDKPKKNSGDRSKKNFEDCCDRAKRYKLRNTYSQKLIDAAVLSFTDSIDTAFDANSALALIIQAKLSKYQYEIFRKATQDIGHNIFSNYRKIIEAKKKCYPDNIDVTEKMVKVSLQDLLDHTSKRIMETKTQEDIKTLEKEHFILHTKWGCDGSSGQSEYMQKFSNPLMDISDSNLFMTLIVPLNMTLAENQIKYVWKNPRPSSRYCRALKFEFIKEILDLIRQERTCVENEIKNLRETEIDLHGWILKVRHILYFTMIDGKVAQAVPKPHLRVTP